MDGRTDECVVRFTMEDILAHLWLLSGQKDVWYYRQENLENRACASFCNVDTVHVQVGVFISVCVAGKLCYKWFFFTAVGELSCSVHVFTFHKFVRMFNAKVEKKKRMGWVVFKLLAFKLKDSRQMTTAYAADTWHVALWEYRTPGAERVKHESTTVSVSSSLIWKLPAPYVLNMKVLLSMSLTLYSQSCLRH